MSPALARNCAAKASLSSTPAFATFGCWLGVRPKAQNESSTPQTWTRFARAVLSSVVAVPGSWRSVVTGCSPRRKIASGETVCVEAAGEAKPNGDAARIRALLVEQVTAPVRFTEIARFLLDNADGFVEVGPGKVLSGIMKRMGAAKFGNVEDPKSLDEVMSWVS